VSALRKIVDPPPPRESASRILLQQLKEAHASLRERMADLDRITAGATEVGDQFTGARWRLSQASMRERALVTQISDYLIERLDGAEADRVSALQVSRQEMMRRSAMHVGTWTAKTIRADWRGYCSASRSIRAHMSTHLQMEEWTLYPLLEALARREG
jgi:hypothetical protein